MPLEDRLAVGAPPGPAADGVDAGGGGEGGGLELGVVCEVDDGDEEEDGGEGVEVFFHPAGGEDSADGGGDFVAVGFLDCVGGGGEVFVGGWGGGDFGLVVEVVGLGGDLCGGGF